MPITYENHDQITMLWLETFAPAKTFMLENKITQRQIADKLDMKPQGLTKLMNKKNFGFDDAAKILDAIGYDLLIDFKSKN